eukprot:4759173-Prymnesium_polylepis.1
MRSHSETRATAAARRDGSRRPLAVANAAFRAVTSRRWGALPARHARSFAPQTETARHRKRTACVSSASLV